MSRRQAVSLLRQVVRGSVTAEEFSREFEHLWNFELNDAEFSTRDLDVLSDLFDIVAWYTPIAADRASYPGFKNEGDVKQAAKCTLALLTGEAT